MAGGDPIAWGDISALQARATALESPPLCIVKHSVIAGIATGGAVLPWDTDLLDPLNWHNPASNNSRIIPTINGWYQVNGNVQFASSTTAGRRAAAVRVNGATLYYGTVIPNTTTGGNLGAIVITEVPLNGTTDYVELYAYQDTGGSLNIGDLQSTRLSCKLQYRL